MTPTIRLSPMPGLEDDAPVEAGPEYPRISDLLGRLREQQASPRESPEGPVVSRELAAALVADAVAPELNGQVLHVAPPAGPTHREQAPRPPHREHVVAGPRATYAARGAYDTALVSGQPTRPATIVERPTVDQHRADAPGAHTAPLSTADFEADELEALVDDLALREVAREALRARLIAFGEGRHHRSAYELVFLMLAFAVMVLITAPPLVDVLLAVHGTAP